MSFIVNSLRKIGNASMKYTSHLCYARLPEFPLLSLLVLPRPRKTRPENPER
jgi:hypothetical protein